MIAEFVAKRKLQDAAVATTTAIAMLAFITFSVAVSAHLDSAGRFFMALGGAFVMVATILVLGLYLVVAADRVERDSRDSELSAKYGVTVRHRHGEVWEIDGEPRLAVLTPSNVLLVRGAEVPLAVA